ncbi:transcriptional regulator [Aeromonas veronii]
MKSMLVFDRISGRIFCNETEIGRLNYSDRLIFELLISERNKIVHKDVLLATGWPERIVVPNSLTIAIRNIRGALERAGIYNEPETIPKMGYRLSLDVGVIEGDLDIQQAASASPSNEAMLPMVDSEPISAIGKQFSKNRDTHFAFGFILDIWRILKPSVYSNIYAFYVFIMFVLSVYLYGARLFAEPDFSCVDYESLSFCGEHKIDKNNIPNEFFLNSDGGNYWFTERDDEFLFFKVD